jgi:hypothetical protein
MMAITASDARRAQELFEKDARARALAMSCVAYAMKEYGPIDPDHADRAAHDIASFAANLLISRLYIEDNELREQKELAERYKELAFKTAASSYPPRMVKFDAAD